jgi:hypothetical protein
MSTASTSAGAAPPIEDDGEDDVEIDIEEMGSGGPSVQAIRRAAIIHFANFLAMTKVPRGTTIDNVEPTEPMLKQFATCLAEKSRTKRGALISCGSALNYLSQVKEELKRRTPILEMWRTAEG